MTIVLISIFRVYILAPRTTKLSSWLQREFNEAEISIALVACAGDKAPKLDHRGHLNKELNATLITRSRRSLIRDN